MDNNNNNVILPIIKTSLNGSKLELNEVVLKETYVLRNFKLINTVDYPVQVKLKSDLPQISFQLNNENMQDDSDETPIQDDDFNQLFNEVNLIDQVILAPKEIKNIVISYRPFDQQLQPTTSATTTPTTNIINDDSNSTTPPTSTSNLTNTTNIINTINTPSSNNIDNNADSNNSNNNNNNNNNETTIIETNEKEKDDNKQQKNDRFNYFEVKGKIYFQIESLLENVELVQQQKELVVDVMIRICKSFLKLDVNELIFDDCIVGQTYVKDITLWNKCEMPLRFSTYYKEKFSNYFQFTDYATGLPLSRDNRIVQSYGSMTIRLTYQPTSVGQFTYKFKLENKNDSSSYEIVIIHSSVSAEQQIELLQVSNNYLDLGDCYTDVPTFQTFTIKNISEEPIDINFSCDLIKSISSSSSGRDDDDDDEVTFHFHEEDTDKLLDGQSKLSLGENRSNDSNDDLIGKLGGNSSTGGNKNNNSGGGGGSGSGSGIGNSGSGINSSNSGGNNSNQNSGGSGIGNDKKDNNKLTSSGSNTNRSMEQIEELTINPGSERVIQVRYCPKRLFPITDTRSQRLTDKNFRILLKYNKSSLGKLSSAQQKNKTIRVSSRVCTSVVTIPLEINLGDCTVGTTKGHTIQLVNLSDLAASMQLRFQSKVVSFKSNTFSIPPNQTYDLQMDFLPRKNNPDYRKQITFINLKNPINDQQFLEVRANNIDEHSVSVHSKFYHFETSYNKSYIDFDETIVNCPSVRTFSIKNISKGTLVLNLSTSLPDEIKLYTEEKDLSSSTQNQISNKQHLQEYLSKFFDESKNHLDKSSNNSGDKVGNSSYLDLALIPSSGKKLDKQQQQLDSTKSSDQQKPSPQQQSPQQQSQDSKDSKQQQQERKKKLTTSHDQSNPNSRTNSRASSPSFDSSNNNSNNNNNNSSSSSSSSINTNILNESGSNISGFGPGSLSSHSLTNIPIVNSSNNSIKEETESTDNDQQSTQQPTQQQQQTLIVNSSNSNNSNNQVDFLTSSSLIQFIQSFEYDNDPPLFTDSESEINYITSQINRLKKLDTIIQSGQLKKVDTLELEQQSEVTIFIVSNVNDSKRPWLGGKLKNMEAKMFISLVSLNGIKIHDSPIRELNVGTKICKSIMDLAQRNINFGNIIQYDYRTKSLVINNLSQVPLIYRIKKSGSITSGNLNIENTDRMGIVRPYRKREIQFVFKPTFSGIFDEKLIIENVYDQGNNQTVHIKANVKKPRHFFLNTLDIDFGVVMIKGKSITKRITLTNTSNQKRIFKIIDEGPSSFESCLNKLYFKLEEKSAFSISKETEVEIDLLERKLKICRRKGQHEKALKINMQIEKLRNSGSVTPNPVSRATSPTPIDDSTTTASTTTTQVIEKEELLSSNATEVIPAPAAAVPQVIEKKQFCKIGDNSITFEVEGGGIQNVLVYFSPVPKPGGKRQWYGKDEGNGSILIYESKNIDVTKKINYVATVCYDEETYHQNYLTSSAAAANGGINGNNNLPSFSPFKPQQFTSNPINSRGIIPSSPPPPPLSPSTTTTGSPPIGSGGSGNILSSTTSIFKPTANKSTAPTPTNNSNILTLSPGRIDLGEVRIYEDITFRFTIINHTGYKIPFDINLKPLPTASTTTTTTTSNNNKNIILLKEKNGIIEPYGKRSIEVICQPQIPGKQTHTIVINSVQYHFESNLLVSLSGRPPQYVMFPDLPPHSQILDFGNCYYDKSQKFSKVLPFRLDNLSHKSLYITMKSNLTQQVFVFLDERYSCPADNLFLQGYEKSVVYICLNPSMTSENYVNGHCRELVGGIRIKVADSDHNLLYENTIKFTSIIGKSILRVTKNVIDLGSTRQLGETISSSITISNLSTLLPLKYQVSHSKNLKLNSKLEGLLEGSEVNHALSRDKIHFSLTASIYGLYEEKVVITNLNCSGQKIEINIRLLVDDSSLTTNLPINVNGGGDMLKFDDIYVSPVSWNEKVAASDRKLLSFVITPQQFNADSNTISSSGQLYQQKQFTMRNHLKYDIRIYPKSNINVYLFLHEPTKEELQMVKSQFGSDRKKSMRLCAKPFVLSSEQKVIAYPQPPEPDSIITTKQKLMLCKGRKVKFQGTLVFERSDSTHYPIAPGEGKTHISKLVSISGSFCMSMGEILQNGQHLPNLLDIGRVGYENSWKEIYITTEIRNLSEIPLVVRVVSLPSKSIRILLNQPNNSNLTSPSTSSNRINFTTTAATTTSTTTNTPLKIKSVNDEGQEIEEEVEEEEEEEEEEPPFVFEVQIPSSESKQIIIAIDPTKIEQTIPGPICYPIQFENVMNEFNTMSANVQLYQTFRVLNFNRLTTGEANSNNNGDIVLPSIYHPPLIGASSQSDEWFTIENTSNKSLKIQSEVELLPQFSNLIFVELVHKTSNTPIPSFSLRPQEVIEVRIRAKPRPDSKLRERFDELTTFGKITFNTNIYPIEVIPLKGTILPGQNFTLSLNRLNFNLISRITNKEGEEQSLLTTLEDYFKIKNTSSHYPLKFKVEGVFNQNSWLLPTSCVQISPEEGEIPPNELMNVNVNINLTSNIDDIPPSSSFVVMVSALDSLNNETQKVVINLIGNYKPIPNPSSPSSNVDSSSSTSSSKQLQQSQSILQQPSSSAMVQSVVSSNNTPNSNSTSSTPISVSSQIIAPPAIGNLNDTINTNTAQQPLTSSSIIGNDNITPISTGNIITINKLPKLSLRGCTPIARLKNCYEIHLSQQEFSSGSIPWELTLENLSMKPVEYSIYSMKENDDTWLNLSRNSGKIEPHGRHIITANFSTKRIDMYSTYLIIENRNNPADIKTIQITFDVVVKQNSHFSVLVEGKQNSTPVINLGDVFYNITYTDRSFIVSNSSSMPLDFMLSTSLPPNDSTEVCFSLSRSYLRQFNTLYVEPNSQVKVFVYFHVPSLSTSLDTVTQKDIKIFLNCRLIRDYQQIITLSATCRYPQMKLSDQNIVFKGKIILNKDEKDSKQQQQQPPQQSLNDTVVIEKDQPQPQQQQVVIKKSNESTNTTTTATSSKSSMSGSGSTSRKVDIEFDESSSSNSNQIREISIYNNFNDPLTIVVKANTIFFIVDPPSNGIITIDPMTSSCITVRPNIPAILEHSNLLIKEKYLEEHIIVYNKNSLTEKYVVSLRITTGQLTSFSASSGLKGGYHYRSLEQLITKFIRKFKKFWYSLYLYCVQTNNQQLQQQQQQQLLLQQQQAQQAQQQAQQGGLNNSQNSLLLKSSSLLSLITSSDSNWSTPSSSTTSSSSSIPSTTVTTPTTSTNIGGGNTSSIFGSTKLTTEELKEMENIFDILENDNVDNNSNTSHEQQQSIFHESYQRLLFDLHHITNELVLYGLKKQVGQLPSQLATLFYFNLFKHGVFKVILKMKRQLSKSSAATLAPHIYILNASVESLNEFLSYFPEKREDLQSLRNLQSEVIKAVQQSNGINNNNNNNNSNSNSNSSGNNTTVNSNNNNNNNNNISGSGSGINNTSSSGSSVNSNINISN